MSSFVLMSLKWTEMCILCVKNLRVELGHVCLG